MRLYILRAVLTHLVHAHQKPRRIAANHKSSAGIRIILHIKYLDVYARVKKYKKKKKKKEHHHNPSCYKRDQTKWEDGGANGIDTSGKRVEAVLSGARWRNSNVIHQRRNGRVPDWWTKEELNFHKRV